MCVHETDLQALARLCTNVYFYGYDQWEQHCSGSDPPVGSGRISQACWDTGRRHRSCGPLWTRPRKSTTASVQFYHPERAGANLREDQQERGEEAVHIKVTFNYSKDFTWFIPSLITFVWFMIFHFTHKRVHTPVFNN